MRPGRARGRLPRGRAPGILIVAGMAVACAAFAFCVIASVTYHWHRSLTGPGIAVSFVAMVACVLAANLLGDDQDGDQ
jgi:hypothetical protein